MRCKDSVHFFDIWLIWLRLTQTEVRPYRLKFLIVAGHDRDYLNSVRSHLMLET